MSAMHAIFPLNLLSSVGSGVILAAVLSGIFILRLNGGQWPESLRQTWVSLKMLILFLAIMFGSSYLARYSGLDAIKGLAYTQTGSYYPFLASLFGAISSLIYGCVAASATCFNAAQERGVAAGQIFRSVFFYMMLLAVLQGLLFLQGMKKAVRNQYARTDFGQPRLNKIQQDVLRCHCNGTINSLIYASATACALSGRYMECMNGLKPARWLLLVVELCMG